MLSEMQAGDYAGGFSYRKPKSASEPMENGAAQVRPGGAYRDVGYWCVVDIFLSRAGTRGGATLCPGPNVI
jgi:hypothetical protein